MNKEVVYACSELTEFQSFMKMDFLKQSLLEQTGGGDAFIESTIPAIKLQVLGTVRNPESLVFLRKLRKAGYDDEMICRVLAHAWLAESETFALPAMAKMNWWRTTKGLWAISSISTLLIVAGLMLYLRSVDTDDFSIVLVAGPLLAIVPIVIGVVIFKSLNRVLNK